MTTSNNSGNRWGWFGLIVVVALLGAGYLYQREGGRLFGPAVEGHKDEPQVDSR